MGNPDIMVSGSSNFQELAEAIGALIERLREAFGIGTGTNYLFFITYHGCKKFECEEYNRTWRCWTKRPTDEQRKTVKWE